MDVGLTQRSAAAAIDGLAISAYEPLTTTLPVASVALPVVTGDEGWYPARDFDWATVETLYENVYGTVLEAAPR
jgi:hypothetical protein